jgi:hypothetical protein
MAVSITFFIVAIAIVAIWVLIEIKRLKHKLFAFFLIGLILFTYISFTVSLKNENVDLKTIPGLVKAGKLYAAWLGTAFQNIKSITAYAINQDWKDYDKSALEEDDVEVSDLVPGASDIWNKL